ncbi:MAG TPA: RHS repeat-associated core domain-containing protein [Acidimicrobiales bacterium]|nr:RHS repeat-associated core domain-containing protein [Acidimicrobiales bacterium]
MASALVLAAREPVEAAGPTYADVIEARDPVAYFRLGETSTATEPVNEIAGGVGGEWTGDLSKIGLGVPTSGFDGNTAASLGPLSGSPPTPSLSGLEFSTEDFRTPSASFEAWIKPSGLPPDPEVTPASFPDANLLVVDGCCWGSREVGLWMTLTSSGTVRATVGQGLWGESVDVESTETVTDGQWHHVVAVYEEVSKSLWIVVDGDDEGVQAADFPGLRWGDGAAGDFDPLVVGRPLNGPAYNEGYQYQGAIDEIAVYDKALTLEDIRENFLASDHPTPPGWNVPEGPHSGSDILGPNAAKDWDELLRCHCADPVDTGSGNLHMPIAPVSVPGRGPGLGVSMAYNSLAADRWSSIGYGWSSTLDMRLWDEPYWGGKTVVQETGATVAFRGSSSGSFLAPDGYTATLTAQGSDWLFIRNHTERFLFDSAGRLKSLSDQFGNTTTVSYPAVTAADPAFRQPSAITDAAGRSLTLAWHGSWASAGSTGKLASITEPVVSGEPAGRKAEFSYDSAGNLTSYKDVSGGTTTFTYFDAEHSTEDHLMTKMRRPRHLGDTSNSKVIENNYDATGRVEWQRDELNRRTDFAYDTPSAGRTTVTMPPYDDSGIADHRHKRIDTYENGVRTQTITAAGTAAQQTTNYKFKSDTNAPEWIEDNAGKKTEFTSDAAGNVLTVKDPTNRITTYTYGIFDQVTSVAVGQKGSDTSQVVTTTNQYNATNGRLEATTVAAGTADAATTSYEHATTAHPEDVTTVVDPLLNRWDSGYNAGTGYLEWSENPEDERTAYTYNEIGWPLTVTSPEGVKTATAGDYQTSYSYDIANRSTTVTGPVKNPGSETGDKVKTVLDANGNVSSTSSGATLGDTTTYTYNDADELTNVKAPDETSKSYAYFPNGAQKSFTNELSAVTGYTYDAGGNLLTETDPLGRTTTNTYDSVGRLKTVKQDSVSGATCTAATKVGCITYFYDDASRITGIDYSDPDTPDLVDGTDFTNGIHYDNLGRRDAAHARTGSGAATAASWDETWAWTKRSQISSHTDRNGDTTGYKWDKTGNLTELTYPGNRTVVRTFDSAGMLKTSTDWSSRTATFDYDDDSNWTGTAFGSVNNDAFAYDAAGRMTAATWKQGVTTLGAETYTRPTGTKGMVDATTPSGAAGSAATDNVYDTRNRLTDTHGVTSGATEFAVDAASNLTKGPGGRNQQFNKAQELCWASPTKAVVAANVATCPAADAGSELYTYDTLGRRLTTTFEDNVVRTHSYDQANRLTKVADTTGNPPTTSLADMDGQALVGNFDGDTEDDVFFYRSTNTSNDDWVFWGAARNQFGSVNGRFSVGSGYTPATGDFNCDGIDDILWYKPGTGNDYVWFWFGRYSTSSPNGAYTSKQFTITNSFVPVTGDFNADGCSDVLWYAAGSATDAIWWGDDDVAVGTNQFDLGAANVGGTFEPVAGDFDGNGADDVFWYAPGTDQDYLWMFAATGGTYTSYNRTVNTTTYDLAAGDVNGDDRDDLLFYNPSGQDVLWWGAAEASFGSSNQKILPSIDAGQAPVIGDFDGDGREDLFLYKPAATGDTIWWGAPQGDFSTVTGFQNTTTARQTSYTYDTDGIRATKQTDSGTAQKFTYSSGTGLPLLLTQKSGTDTTYLVYGPGGQPIEQINPDGTATWLHHDQLGSVRLATKATDGTEHSRRSYDPYGTVATQAVTTEGNKQPLLSYAGQYTDTETGYQYLRARYYDPTTAQFLTKDPIAAKTQEPYGYASQNPSTLSDPTGMCPWGMGLACRAVNIATGHEEGTKSLCAGPQGYLIFGGGLDFCWNWDGDLGNLRHGKASVTPSIGMGTPSLGVGGSFGVTSAELDELSGPGMSIGCGLGPFGAKGGMGVNPWGQDQSWPNGSVSIAKNFLPIPEVHGALSWTWTT